MKEDFLNSVGPVVIQYPIRIFLFLGGIYGLAVQGALAGWILNTAPERNRAWWLWLPLMMGFHYLGLTIGSSTLPASVHCNPAESNLFIVGYFWNNTAGLLCASLPCLLLFVLPPRESWEDRLAQIVLDLGKIPKRPK